MKKFILAIDQGTTSSRAILFDEKFQIKAIEQTEISQKLPKPGWVEHNPEEIWETVIAVCKRVMSSSKLEKGSVVSIGITNQRETTIVWDRRTGVPIYNAIVWQDRRTVKICEEHKINGYEESVKARTGLIIDPYFSGTKIAWLLDNVCGARKLAEGGHLAFGTIDTFLLWRLTDGNVHATDATNASRTMLYNIITGEWDDELLTILRVPRPMLPKIMDNMAKFGETSKAIFGESIPISGMVGDQQAALIGQACFSPGMIKSTYGTGGFALLNTGETPVRSNNQMLTTVAFQFQGIRTYALEGSIFIAGAAIQWLRDELKLIDSAKQSEGMAFASDENEQVVFVPAFTGLGAPHWAPNAKGAIFGLTRATGPNELARAALEAVCFQTLDLLTAMYADWPDVSTYDSILRVDGGMASNNWCMQFLADILGVPVERSSIIETTSFGAAYIAGLNAGIYPDKAIFSDKWKSDQRFEPEMRVDVREEKYARWQEAIKKVLLI